MEIACLDLEGVLVPEIWIAFAEKTGINPIKIIYEAVLLLEILDYTQDLFQDR